MGNPKLHNKVYILSLMKSQTMTLRFKERKWRHQHISQKTTKNWNYSKQSVHKLYVVHSTSRSHALRTKSSIKWLCHVIKWLCHVFEWLCHVIRWLCHVFKWFCHVLLVIFVPCNTLAVIDSILFNVIHEHISAWFCKGSFTAPVRTTWEQRKKKKTEKKTNNNLRVRITLSQIARASPTT